MHRQTKDGAVITIASGSYGRPPGYMGMVVGVAPWIQVEGDWYRWVGTTSEWIDLTHNIETYTSAELVQLLNDDAIAQLYCEDGALVKQ